MSCQACNEFQESGRGGTYFRWKNANIEIRACEVHMLEIFDALKTARLTFGLQKKIANEPFCIVCGNPAPALGDDPGGMLYRIEIPSCKTPKGFLGGQRTRIVYICVRCADDLRNFLRTTPNVG